jgi:CubicO group peptidase (beta-lactamase class C family)
MRYRGRHEHGFPNARDVLARSVELRVFPGASVEVGGPDGVLWRDALGSVSYEPDAAPVTPATIFDLASLTKVIATATLVMGFAERGRICIDTPLGRWLPEWRGHDRDWVTIADALAHCTGLPGWVPLYLDHEGRQEFQPVICALPLEYAPRTQSLYSDLGFMLLGFVVEDAGGEPLDVQFDALAARLSASVGTSPDENRTGTGAPAFRLTFRPPRGWRRMTAPTEVDRWRGRLLVGEVHDENAWALGGVAGHAGLFGNVASVGRFGRAMLRTLMGRGEEALQITAGTVRRFITRAGIPGSSRALGWDTMMPTSSCGRNMSPSAFGHTGFTGTSLWIDPEAGLYVVLLTNRVHPTRDNEAIQQARPALHDAVFGDWQRA